MYPRTHARSTPDKVAARLVDTGDELTYGQLDERSTRLARVLADAGLRRGDVVALLATNDLRALEVYWAALRSGLYITAVNHHLSPDEVAYIVTDSEAAALVVSADKGDVALGIVDRTPDVRRIARHQSTGEGRNPGAVADNEQVHRHDRLLFLWRSRK